MTAATYPSPEVLSQFRARTALTNQRAGWHYMALARASRGEPWNKNFQLYPIGTDRQTAADFARERWFQMERLAAVRKGHAR